MTRHFTLELQTTTFAVLIFLFYSNRSAAHAALKQFEDALKDATVCTELDPFWAKGWYRRGLAQVGLERYRDAEESYRRGVGTAPPNDSTILSRTDVLLT